MMDTFAWMLLFTYLFGCCIEVLCFPVALVTEEARERPESGASRGWHRRRFLDRCQDDVDHHSKHFGLAFGIMEIVLRFFGGI